MVPLLRTSNSLTASRMMQTHKAVRPLATHKTDSHSIWQTEGAEFQEMQVFCNCIIAMFRAWGKYFVKEVGSIRFVLTGIQVGHSGGCPGLPA